VAAPLASALEAESPAYCSAPRLTARPTFPGNYLGILMCGLVNTSKAISVDSFSDSYWIWTRRLHTSTTTTKLTAEPGILVGMAHLSFSLDQPRASYVSSLDHITEQRLLPSYHVWDLVESKWNMFCRLIEYPVTLPAASWELHLFTFKKQMISTILDPSFPRIVQGFSCCVVVQVCGCRLTTCW